MKSASVKIDTENDLINIYGRDVKLINAPSGHYLLEIKDYIMNKEKKYKESVVLITNFEGMEDKERNRRGGREKSEREGVKDKLGIERERERRRIERKRNFRREKENGENERKKES